jgi:hypothetical protein
VIGRTIARSPAYTIVGVMREPSTFPPRGSTINGEPAALFVPMSFTPFELQAFGMMSQQQRRRPVEARRHARRGRSEIRSLQASDRGLPPPLEIQSRRQDQVGCSMKRLSAEASLLCC